MSQFVYTAEQAAADKKASFNSKPKVSDGEHVFKITKVLRRVVDKGNFDLGAYKDTLVCVPLTDEGDANSVDTNVQAFFVDVVLPIPNEAAGVVGTKIPAKGPSVAFWAEVLGVIDIPKPIKTGDKGLDINNANEYTASAVNAYLSASENGGLVGKFFRGTVATGDKGYQKLTKKSAV